VAEREKARTKPAHPVVTKAATCYPWPAGRKPVRQEEAMRNRRKLLGAVGAGALALIAPHGAFAQGPDRIRRVGYMALPTSTPNVRFATFKQALRDLGYVEGRNVAIEYRSAEGRYERFPAIADELVRLKVDVLVADDGTPSVIAARDATRTIPIVFTVINDPVASGIVKSLAHPGANVTGLALQSPETTAKRLQMLKEIVPGARRVAILVNPGNASMDVWRQELPVAARKLDVELMVEKARTAAEIEAAFDRAVQAADALIVFDDGLFYAEAARICSLATGRRLPVMGGNSVIAEAGCLASYGANRLELVRRSALFVDKILKGASPADLPIEQASKFDLVINQRTANALGHAIPQPLLLRADQVIQ
jgi:putative ABC transport system substrate-binding protein